MCICCLTCCCARAPMKTLNIALFILITISLIFSFITTLNRAGKTSRYKEDLELLKLGTKKLFLVCSYFDDDDDRLRALNERTYFYDDNGRKIVCPEEEISYVSFFKNWEKGELTVNLLRFFLTLFHFLISGYLLLMRSKNLDLLENSLQRATYLSIGSLSFSIILLIFTIIIEYLRSLTLITDDEIGMYDVNKITTFVHRSVWNTFLDTILIILFSICISFSYRLYHNAKYNKGRNIPVLGVQQTIRVNQPNVIIPQNQPGIIMVDQNGQYSYAQPIPTAQVMPVIIYQGYYNNQMNNQQGIPNMQYQNIQNVQNMQNIPAGNNNIISNQGENPQVINEKYNV